MVHSAKEEEIMDSDSNKGQKMDETEHISELKHARRGKLAHFTKRKNIMIELMEDMFYVQEVKDNFKQYKQLLEDFKTTHEWSENKMTEMNEFLSSVSEWL